MDRLRLTILGCGSSGGVPRVGDGWGACDPDEPKNRRTRCSLLVERFRQGARRPTRLIVDTAPDMRFQLLAAGVDRIDGVLFSHDHADQTHGIDDLRTIAYAMRQRIPTWLDEATASTLMVRFAYCFHGADGYPGILQARPMPPPGRALTVEGPGGPIAAIPLTQDHGVGPSLGFRFGPAAYNNDVVDLPEASFALLGGLKLWIVDALRYTPHPTHAHVEKSLGWIARLAPERAVLTNLHIDLDYNRLAAETPAHVEPAFDGWSWETSITEDFVAAGPPAAV